MFYATTQFHDLKTFLGLIGGASGFILEIEHTATALRS